MNVRICLPLKCPTGSVPMCVFLFEELLKEKKKKEKKKADNPEVLLTAL